MKPSPAFVVALAFLAAVTLALVLLSTIGPHGPAVAQVQAQMTPLVNAINTYQLEKGQLPDKLDQLVPQFLKAFPTPLSGSSGWRYETWGAPKLFFSVTVEFPDYSLAYRSDLSGRWAKTRTHL